VPESYRLIILTVLALIVIGAFLYFNYLAYKQDDIHIDPEEHVEAPEVNRIPGANVDKTILEKVRDDEVSERVIKEKQAYLHLIQQAQRLVYGDMELLGVTSADAHEVLNDPSAFRGDPLEIKGILQWFEKYTELESPLYRGYLTSQEGDHFYFTLMDIPNNVRVGDIVKLQGFFFKIYSFTVPGEDRRINDAVFLIGKRLIPSFFEMPQANEIDMELLETLYDYDIQDMGKPFEEKPFYHLLSYTHNLDEDKAGAMEFEELLPIEILKAPGKHRGAPVKVLGEVVWLEKRQLGPQGENPVGPEMLHHGVLCNYRGYFCYFMAFDIPDWVTAKSKDLVYANGFFFRNYAYRTRTEHLQPAPVVLVHGFEKFVLPEDNRFQYISIAVLVGTALASLFLIIHIFRDRKQSKEFREKFIEKKKKQLARVMNENPESYQKKQEAGS